MEPDPQSPILTYAAPPNVEPVKRGLTTWISALMVLAPAAIAIPLTAANAVVSTFSADRAINLTVATACALLVVAEVASVLYRRVVAAGTLVVAGGSLTFILLVSGTVLVLSPSPYSPKAGVALVFLYALVATSGHAWWFIRLRRQRRTP